MRLSEQAGGTLISYEVDAQVGGRMAQLGGPIIDATARQLAGKFFSRFGERVGGTAKSSEHTPVKASAAQTAAPTMPAPATLAGHPSAPLGGLPMVWVLATVVAVLTGFLVGRSEGLAGSDWAGIAIGLLLIVVAGAAFEYGRRSAVPVLMLDSTLLRRLIDGAKE